MSLIRICPISKWPCVKKLPPGVSTMTVNHRIAVCGIACATAYAHAHKLSLVGEHRVSGPGGSSLEYSCGVQQNNPEKGT